MPLTTQMSLRITVRYKGDKGGTATFELLNRYNQALASGIYIYHVEARDESDTVVGNKIGRFAIIR